MVRWTNFPGILFPRTAQCESDLLLAYDHSQEGISEHVFLAAGECLPYVDATPTCTISYVQSAI